MIFSKGEPTRSVILISNNELVIFTLKQYALIILVFLRSCMISIIDNIFYFMYNTFFITNRQNMRALFISLVAFPLHISETNSEVS